MAKNDEKSRFLTKLNKKLFKIHLFYPCYNLLINKDLQAIQLSVNTLTIT